MDEIGSGTATEEALQKPRLIAPWWHTALMVLLIVGLSASGAQQIRGLSARPLHLKTSYTLTIGYEWALALLALWGIRMRAVPLRTLVGEWRAGARGWLQDLGAAFLFWIVALMLLAVIAEALLLVSGSHIDPRKIGEITGKLAPVTGVELALFLVLSISAGICEELVFRGYLQQQFARMGGRVWIGVVLSALVFGGAHGYEGIAGVAIIAAYGAMFGVLAVLRRGLRAGMIAHAWHDVIAGLTLMLMRHLAVHG